jgi:EAL domain-containing protein (putative c-di-GMP-specific phosphodiesterase class I)/GGDEF domain-containing protein
MSLIVCYFLQKCIDFINNLWYNVINSKKPIRRTKLIMEEFNCILSRHRCISVRIEVKKDLPLTVGKEYQKDKKSITVNLVDLINAEDLTVVLTKIDELSAGGNNSNSLRVTCRFVPDNKPYLICCEMRREKRRGKPADYLYGVIMDASELHANKETEMSNQREASKSNSAQFSADFDMGIVDIIGREQLSRMQIPLNGGAGVVSAILTKDEKLICCADLSVSEFNVDKFSYSKRVYIKINHTIYAIWVIASDDNSLIERFSPVHDILAENLSKLANSYVMLYKEMVNNENANKLLSETIEQQMLLNSIYTKVLKERNTMKTMRAVVDMAGEFLKLDRIIVCEDFPESKKYKQVYEWASLSVEVLGEKSKLSEFQYSEYPDLVEELSYYETYFSNNPEHDVLGFNFSSYVASNLVGDGSKYGIIIYLVNDTKRVLTPAEKRLLRSVSQIITAVIMRCKDNEALDIRNQRLHHLAYHDQNLGVKNKTSLENDVRDALESGHPGVVVAFKIPNMKDIYNFAGHERANGILTEILENISDYAGLSAEPYRFSEKIFMVLLRSADLTQAREFCDVLVERFHHPWDYFGSEHYLDITAGLVPYSRLFELGTTVDDIYRAAIMSMDKAEEFGVNSYAIFSEAFEEPEAENYYCTQILRNAVEGEGEVNGLEVRYTPIYSGEKEIVSCAATLALELPLDEQPYPSRILMQIAEKMGIDVTIDSWVIKQACEFCMQARKKSPDFKVIVDATSRTLSTRAIVKMVSRALEETGLSARGLSVQFSERVIAVNYEEFLSVLSELQKLGVSVILDGIGSYYSAASLLRHSGISAATADITIFTGRIDDFSEAYTKGIVKLAKDNSVSLGIKSIQNEEQLEVDLVQEADWYQGGLYSNEMSENELLGILGASSDSSDKAAQAAHTS